MPQLAIQTARRWLPCLCLLFLAASRGVAAVGDWTTYSFTGDVRAIAFDQATLWLATSGAAVRYDAAADRFTVFTNTDGLAGNVLTSAVVDRNRDVWFGTLGNGLSRRRFSTGGWRTFSTLDGLASQQVRSLWLDETTLWVGTDDGLSVFVWDRDDDEARDTFVFSDAYRASRGVPVGGVNDLTLSASSIWVGTETGVATASRNASNLKDPLSWSLFNRSHGLPNLRVTAIVTDSTTVWAGTPSGVARYNGSSWVIVNTGLPSLEIRDLAFVDGQLLAVTVNGTARFNGVSWIPFGGGTGAQGPRTIAADGEGTTWIGAARSGLGRLENGLWQFLDAGGPASNDVDVLYVDENKTLWVGFENAGVSRLDSLTWTSYTTADGLVADPITLIGAMPDGRKWFGSFGHGLARLNDQGSTDKSDDIWEQFDQHNSVFKGIPEDPNFVVVNTWARDAAGGQWFSNFEVGAQFLSADGQWTTFRPRVGELSNARIRDIAVGADSSVWFATDNRLSRYFPEQGLWTVYGTAEGLGSAQINAVAVSVSGDVWVGDDAGITRFEPSGARSSIGLAPGLNTSQVTALDTDARGNVWVGTPSGLGRFDPESFVWTVFTPDNSPLAAALVKVLVVNRTTGEIWVGGGQGISRFESGILPPRRVQSAAVVFPNPVEATRGDNEVVFSQLADGAQIVIVTIDGLLVRELPASNIVAQRSHWDLKNTAGQTVAGGVYLYVVTAPDGSHTAGKIAIIR